MDALSYCQGMVRLLSSNGFHSSVTGKDTAAYSENIRVELIRIEGVERVSMYRAGHTSSAES